MSTKRKRRTRVNEERRQFGFRIEKSLFKKLLKAAKKDNLYIADYIKQAVSERIKRGA